LLWRHAAVRPGALFSRRTTVPITLKYRHKYRRPRFHLRSKYFIPQRHLADKVVKMEVEQVSSTSQCSWNEPQPSDVISHVLDGTGYRNVSQNIDINDRSIDDIRKTKRCLEEVPRQGQHEQPPNIGWNTKRSVEEVQRQGQHEQHLNIGWNTKRGLEEVQTQGQHEKPLNMGWNRKRLIEEVQRPGQHEQPLNIRWNTKRSLEEVQKQGQHEQPLNIGWNTKRRHEEVPKQFQRHDDRISRTATFAVEHLYNMKAAPGLRAF